MLKNYNLKSISLYLRIQRYSLLIVACYLVSSCALFESAIQYKIEREFSIPTSKNKYFSACVNSKGGSCEISAEVSSSPIDTLNVFDKLQSNNLDTEIRRHFGASLAVDVLSSSLQQDLNEIMSSGVSVTEGLDFDQSPGDALVNIESSSVAINVSDYSKYQNMIEQVTLLDGWSSLEEEFEAFDSNSSGSVTARYISQYMRDYFRDGKIIKLTVDGTSLKNEWSKKLKGILPGLPDESTYNDVAESLLSELGLKDNSKVVWGKISDQGFVTRGGVKSQFPSIEATYDLASNESDTTKIEYSVVGTDLVRVLLHAISDAHNQLPALTESSGTKVKVDGLEIFDESKHGIKAAEFDLIETRASQVEGVIGSGVGRLIRGASVLSLNNESLAQLIETSIAIASRKKSEKIFWCYYSCSNALALANQEDSEEISLDDLLQIRVNYDD